jgi:hypothetical protein
MNLTAGGKRCQEGDSPDINGDHCDGIPIFRVAALIFFE